MLTFKYRAKDRTGKELTGEVNAPDEQSVRALLRDKGYYILQIRMVRPKGTSWSPFRLIIRWFINPIFAGATVQDLAIFYRQLATMTRSGMSLIEAMNSFLEQGGNRRLKKIARESLGILQSGGTLSEAFSRYPWMFPELHVSLIRAGEQSGTIDRMLQKIAEYVEHEIAVRQKLRLSTLYPKILILAVIFIPNSPILFTNPTGETAGHAYFRATFGILVPLVGTLLAAWAAFKLLYQIPVLKYGIDMAKLAIPKTGKMSRMLALSKFYRVFSAMYGAGVSVAQGLSYGGKACGNWYLNRKIVSAIPHVNHGMPLSQALGNARALPQVALDMLKTGERTGNVDEMLTKVAEYTEDEAEVSIIQSTVVLGAVLLLGVAIYIGSIVIGFYQGYARSFS